MSYGLSIVAYIVELFEYELDVSNVSFIYFASFVTPYTIIEKLPYPAAEFTHI